MRQPKTQRQHLLGLAAMAGNLVETSLAVSTRRRYVSAWKRYRAWCSRHGLQKSEASPHSIGLYLTERSQKVGMSSLRQDLAAIRYHMKLQGLEIDDNRELLRRLLKGCRREKSHIPQRKKKIEPELLLRAVELLPDDLKGLRDRALLLTTFASAMRRSEVVRLRWDNLRIERGGFWITTGWSKSGNMIDRCFVPKVSSSMCAWSALLRFRAQCDEDCFYCFPRVTRNVACSDHISDRYLYRLVKRLITELGAPAHEYGAHSLRRGFITAAHHAGATNGDILRVTQHRSERGLFPYIGGAGDDAYQKIIDALSVGSREHDRDHF